MNTTTNNISSMNIDAFLSHGVDIVSLINNVNESLANSSESYNKLFMNIKKMTSSQEANFYDMWCLDTNLRFATGKFQTLEDFVSFDNFISMLDYNLEDDGQCYLVEWKLNRSVSYNLPSNPDLKRDLSKDKHYGFWTRELSDDCNQHLISQIKRRIDANLPIFRSEQKNISTVDVRVIWLKSHEIFDIINRIDARYGFNLDEIFDKTKAIIRKFSFNYKN